MSKLEQALRKSEVRHRALVETAADAIVIIDERGVVQAFNPAAERIFGYTAEEIVGRNVAMLMPEPDRSGHDGYIANYRRTGEAKIIGLGREVTGQRKDGSTFPLDLSIAAWSVDGERFFTGIMRDVTERKRAEDELRDSEARMRAVVETVVDAILTMDEQGRMVAANPAAERLFGYSQEELIGRNVSMLMPEPDRSAHDGYLEHYRSTGERRIIGIGREVTGRPKDGSTFPLDLAVGEFLQGEHRYFTGSLRDITERKRTEERQQLLMAELDHRVKNTLAVVQAIAQRSLGRSDERAEVFTGRLTALAWAHTLLSQSGWRGASLAAIAINTLAPYRDDDPDGWRIMAQGPDVVLSPRAAQTLSLVLHELAANAAKYGSLSAPDGRLDLRWRVRRRGDAPRLVMEWREIDGPPVQQPKSNGFGTDLIESTIAYELDGEVQIDYQSEGVRARIDLPLTVALGSISPAPADEKRRVAVTETPGIRPMGRVLVVEDELLVAKDLVAVLIAAGCDVVGPISRVAEATEVAERETLDAAVLDVRLHDEMVWPVADVLRRRGVPFVFATGYDRPTVFPQHLRDLPRLAKPVPQDRLLSVLADAIAARGAGGACASDPV